MKATFVKNEGIPRDITFDNVEMVYLSIAPKEDKYRYIDIETLNTSTGVVKTTTKASEGCCLVYVIKCFGDRDVVIPFEECTLQAVISENVLK